MAKVKKICRICGKEYTPCSYCENDKMAFHYRTICCSRACAQIYLARVLEAREKLKEAPTEAPQVDVVNTDKQTIDNTVVLTENDNTDMEQEKPKRKYVRKKAVEAEEKKNNEESE